MALRIPYYIFQVGEIFRDPCGSGTRKENSNLVVPTKG